MFFRKHQNQEQMLNGIDFGMRNDLDLRKLVIKAVSLAQSLYPDRQIICPNCNALVKLDLADWSGLNKLPRYCYNCNAWLKYDDSMLVMIDMVNNYIKKVLCESFKPQNPLPMKRQHHYDSMQSMSYSDYQQAEQEAYNHINGFYSNGFFIHRSGIVVKTNSKS